MTLTPTCVRGRIPQTTYRHKLTTLRSPFIVILSITLVITSTSSPRFPKVSPEDFPRSRRGQEERREAPRGEGRCSAAGNEENLEEGK